MSVPATKLQGKLINRMAERFGVDPDKMVSTLKATAFKVKNGEATNEQMMGLLIVAEQYGLNPWTKEIFAFPDKQNGIVPVVGVDGWARIINDNPQFDGMEFNVSECIIKNEGAKDCPEWIECKIYRKDRAHPITVREYLDETYRPAFKGKNDKGKEFEINGPWQTHTKRMLRHKAMIQCSRLAFGFSGIFDEDEAVRIIDAQVIRAEEPPQTHDEIKNSLRKRNIESTDENTNEASVIQQLRAANDPDALDVVMDANIRDFEGDDEAVARITAAYTERKEELEGTE